ncbi:NAD(P)H-binding protein [Patulibacter minatonensis]|uniref:NAD(P)H-binding protein n=1 Tax=Patulibacter minatonensis TaxID=298163 RepID=UPI00047A04BC|nr:NAD(P)H-binding protein [Patulibacter minatonensis]
MTTTPQHSTTTDRRPVLVLGATGKTGRRVADRLRARGVDVRAGSRSASPAFDWDDASTWPAVLDGVRAVYVAYVPDLAVPGAAETVGAFARQATAAGVERIVLLSGRGEPEAERAERAVQAAGTPWTVVRCAWFAQNFDESFLLDPVLTGEVALPVGDVREPFVDVEDIADVAVAALTEDGHAGRLHELTGPEALTFAEAVGAIGAAIGRPVVHTEVPLPGFLAGLAAAGVPEDVAGLMAYLFTEVLDGRNTPTTDGVREALGRPARPFRDYVRDAAARGAWDVPAVAR